ncbi:hypothetical protein IJI79_03185 [Candidatus Saccharibacteria bacterium]|nr:hypothetical protein [Candidatus Saccharibacteria bacterium]
MTEEKKTSEKNIFTPERTVKFFFVSLIGNILVALIVWPLMDLLYNLITGNTFNYTIQGDVLSPTIFMAVFTVVEFIFWGFFYKEKK